MKIVVCAKFVPDATADRRFRSEDNTVDRAGVDGLLSELDEYAVETALTVKEAGDAEVTVLTVGPEQAADAVKKGLQMGADAGVHVLDDAIHGSDAVATSLILSKALGKLEADLVVFGMGSTDGGMGVVPAMVSERLGLPAVTLGSEVTVDGQTVRIRRDGDTASETIEGTLPLVLSVSDQANEPRYPSFKGIMAAKKKPVETWSLADLELTAEQVGGSSAWTEVVEVTARPARTAGTIVTDEDGSGAAGLVEFLSTNKFL
ncbi:MULTISPECIES: electron transfer flavoprotein subunit beta/FixA family protein [Kribbella]|uniref:Electron transfer flavoprotein subunit beta n=2 Tax=Kribbella TaxID=182639 RepID=A0A4R0IL19_9ACTN|nr:MULTISPECIES: electron transfer flavoprotein subunit beta/FixA family protein [Kribbella]TCC21941.1 electron transfer flavoprotein subunit beta/FixA family protein [Kribbella speibonae]TCC31400.1 electron transfer flavoprotein subunit beta/FixA family protein [Kribbella sindirgiensis]TCC34223.1 electron transfer flavoprotein subunit beta/FixA family protein [Kribbella speibonae]